MSTATQHTSSYDLLRQHSDSALLSLKTCFQNLFSETLRGKPSWAAV